MKKSMLYAGLMTILSATAYAEDSSNLNTIQTTPGAINGVRLAMQQGVQLAASDSVQTPSSASDGIQTPTNTSLKTPSTPGTQPPAVDTPTSATSTTTTSTLNTSTTAPASDTVAPTSKSTAPTDGATPATGTTPATGATTTPPTGATTTPPTGAATTPATGAATTPATGAATTPATGAATMPAVAITPAQPLNCNYRIPPETAHIEQTIVMKWAEKAAEQSFDFDFNNLDKQISLLKSCYTDQGWQGFNDALEKSGNINAIKTQQLTVSSMVNGESKITEIKDNQWKITIPMQVVYQNDKEKLTQPLTVNLVIGRKVSGDLGIMQMIAIPRQPLTNNGGESTPETATTTTQKQQ